MEQTVYQEKVDFAGKGVPGRCRLARCNGDTDDNVA
jgi:hypothetical protein